MPTGIYIRTKPVWNKGKVGMQSNPRKGLKLNPLSEEHKGKISLAMKGRKNYWLKGKKLSEEHRKKLKVARQKRPAGFMLGKKHSEETKRKISLRLLGNKYALGYKHSKETREKDSLASKGRKFSEDHKRKIREWHILNPNRKFRDTSIEIKVKELLNTLGIEYISQFPLEKIAIVDFYIPSKKLAIFCDGCYWHGCPEHYPNRIEKLERDNFQTTKLQELGYNVSRFWEHEINNMTTLHI